MSLLNQQPIPPFSMSHSPQLAELLNKLNCTVAISTYQAGKVILINAKDDQKISMLPRTFNKAMGLAIEGNKMAIATKGEVIKLVDAPELGTHYPHQPGKYKNMYVPRATYYTGSVDLHDLHFGSDGLWGVNTSFSCLVKIDDDYSFVPKWKPTFISELKPEDRCHLNGLAMVNGKPKYATALGTGNTPGSWRDTIINGGVLMDVESNEILLKNLGMPHSPRMYQDDLYLLQSAIGEIIKVDTKNRTFETIKKIEGFTRGLAIYKDYLFIGLSKLRKNSTTFSKLSFFDKNLPSGILILHLPTRTIAGEMIYHSSVDEIYDVQIIPNTNNVGILNTENELYQSALSIPGATYWAQPTAENEKE